MPVLETLGYQIGGDCYVKIVRLPDGSERSVTAPSRSGPWSLYVAPFIVGPPPQGQY